MYFDVKNARLKTTFYFTLMNMSHSQVELVPILKDDVNGWDSCPRHITSASLRDRVSHGRQFIFKGLLIRLT